jgi:ABC-type antimicrobial peptide transport system permease subunit
LTIYLPYWQGFLNSISFTVRTQNVSAAGALRAAIAEIDADVPIKSVRTMQGVLSQSVAARAFQATLLTLFGAIALALSTVGVFGTLSYAVTQRSKEFGIRLALGATPRTVQRMVLGNVLRLVVGGVILGAPIALAAGYILRNALFGIGPYDMRVLTASSALIGLVAIVAGWLPAHRATRVNPVAMLRAE